MRKQFFDMYLLLLFARLYYSKSHTLSQETYMSSYVVTVDLHTGHFHLFPKNTVQPPRISPALNTSRPHKNYSTVQSQLYLLYILVAYSNYLQCVLGLLYAFEYVHEKT